ncbi:TonB-dependent receptor plug domain-containing protein [Chitinophaga agrisoli]|uniref:TonB-dependent receptor plug domain-containing protein n=1 Tax=Chitinophaga agrisoli TaxID=2607653 RepID=A0A5B2VNN9_9BACT|nr:alpha-2-macroglobulin family protein [Chitinophaga agrisoli]KAA2239922.1 TonB-dependent receptor plug domain-containing protein [Chitinophaga agrisoli]
MERTIMISIPAFRCWRLILTVLTAAVFTLPAWGQHQLSNGLQHSPYTYIYHITPGEAAVLTKKGAAKTAESYLRTPIDSLLTDKPVPALPAGNYLLVNAVKNELQYKLHTSGDVTAKLLSTGKEQQVILHTGEGRLIPDATVYQDKRRLAYDQSLQVYGPLRPAKAKTVQVYYKDAYYAFPLELQWKRPSLFQKLKRRFFRRDERDHDYGDFYYGNTPYEKKFKGFMVFSQPKYKPGDTVRLKAFVETANGKPVNQPLLLRLSTRYRDTDTILATLQPYRAGGYLYEFVLSAALDLDLDEKYLITLEDVRSRKYDPATYDGNMDDDEYVLQRKVLVRGKFTYEDYELDAITFTARSDKRKHLRGQSPAIYLKAADENGLPVMDGRVQVLVTPASYNDPTFHAPHVFLPDTLWNHSQALETVGETRINLPDSIFPAASFKYEVQCIFLNANNERQTQTLSQTYSDESSELLLSLRADSLVIDHRTGGKTTTAQGTVYLLNEKQDIIAQNAITLPAVLKLDPLAAAYKVTTDSLTERITIPPSDIYCQGSRTADSISLRLIDPLHRPVWYTVFAGNQLILRGYGDTLLYQAATHTPDNYSITLQYLYAGKIQESTYYIPYQDKLLTIHTDQPAVVYPGQSAHIQLQVTDHTGAPVADADVTAYAITKKFEAAIPYVPYAGKTYPARKSYAQTQARLPVPVTYASALNWEKWRSEMQLDTMEYYRFTHPAPFYRMEEQASEGITQIAPFVVSKGNILPIYLLYIDEQPVFFSKAQQLQRYSFPVSEGYHRISLRTRNKQIRVDSVKVTAYRKNMISINLDAIHPYIHVQDMPDTLTRYEAALWRKYMMLVADNFGEDYTYLRQGLHVYLFNWQEHMRERYSTYHQSYMLTGPFPYSDATLVVKRQFDQPLLPEGDWQYRFSKGLTERQQPRGLQVFSSSLPRADANYNFQDCVLTENEINKRWQDYLDERNQTTRVFTNRGFRPPVSGRLKINPIRYHNGKQPFITHLLLFRYDNPDFIHTYPGATTDLGYLAPGQYRLLYLLKDNAFYLQDSITITPKGINYYDAGSVFPYPPPMRDIDSIAAIINSRQTEDDYHAEYDLDRIKRFFHTRYLDTTSFKDTVEGKVINDLEHPLAGVRISLKGTTFSTYTGKDGRFRIAVPGACPLVIESDSYAREFQDTRPGKYYTILLMRRSHGLPEVEARAEELERRKALAYATTTSTLNQLQGRVAGLMIRGASTISPSAPLIIVDGQVYNGRLEELDPGLLGSMNVLKPEAASAIYGSRAAGGAIMITTKNNNTLTAASTEELTAPAGGNTLRQHFRDNAYWQPALRTDANGRASFNVTFPDDITNWQTIFIAMTDNRQSGTLETSVKSFRVLSANMALPQFAIAGDSINVIGKTLYYGTDSVLVKRSFTQDNGAAQAANLLVRNAVIDTFSVMAPNRDSLKLRYTIQKPDGYFDGEERTIPVYRPGVLATNGLFTALNNDTSFRLSLKGDTSPIQLYAETSLLPVLYQETENIRKYEYLCNEQLASKLKAMIVQEKIAEYLHQPFKGKKNIRELLDKLEQTRTAAGLWGWWPDNGPSMWISLHVIEAKMAALQAGYLVSTHTNTFTDYLVYNLDSYSDTEKLSALFLLQQLGAKPDFKRYMDTLERHPLTTYERLRLIELKQRLGMPVQLDTLIARQQHSLMGNIYWGNEGYAFFDNSIQITLSMYRILKKAGGYETLLPRIRNYFLEIRKGGEWRNTYESSMILETILPDLLAANPDLQPSTLTVQGDTTLTTTRFPFAATIRGGAAITISKQGAMPVYFTAYQRYWDTTAASASANFTVHTSFDGNAAATVLKAGKPVVVTVAVQVKETADYVMIEIPIPAGCSYVNKGQSYQSGEVHREYFKQKVSIFCSKLYKGNHSFTIQLLPRYTGTYTLNPAKAEMMYFPVFNGREGIRKLRIE